MDLDWSQRCGLWVYFQKEPWHLKFWYFTLFCRFCYFSGTNRKFFNMKITVTFLSAFSFFNSILYSQILPSDLQWNDDETGFYMIKENNITLVSVTGEKDTIILSSKVLGEISIESFDLSENKNKILLFTNAKKVWRYKTRGDYFVFDLKQQKLIKIGKDFPPSSLMFAKFSADEKSIAYVVKYNLKNNIRNRSTSSNIFIEDLEKGTIRKLTTSEGKEKLINGTFDWVYEEEFSCRDGFIFNDDGTKIAFWQVDASAVKNFYMINNTDSIYSFTIPVEYPKVGQDLTAVKIGIINLKNQRINWVPIPGAPDKFYLPRMTWIPESDQLMIQQLNRKQNHSKIYLHDTQNGDTELILEDTDAAWVDVRASWSKNQLAGWKFIDNGKSFLYLSEKDGWAHLYNFNLKTKKEKLVTKGAFDVINPLAYDKNNKQVYFIASKDNPTERYLYSCSVTGIGKVKKITPEILDGVHSYSISTNAKYALHSFSNYYTRPMRAVISLPKHNYVNPEEDIVKKFDPEMKMHHPMEFFKVTTVDDTTIEGWIVKPKDMVAKKKYPVLFYFYSEPAGQTGLNRYGAGINSIYDGNLSDDGYVYVTFDGRGTPAPKGRDWRKAIYKKIGQINVRDMAMGAKAIFKKYNFIDTTRVAVHGWSGGGTATLNCLFQYPEIFHTGIAVAAVTNQLTYDNIYQERYMGSPFNGLENYINGSPLKYVENFKGNLLYIHGTGDDNVHYQNAELLANELIKHKKVFYMLPYPNRSHSIREDNAYPHVRLMFTDFLRKNCPPGGK